MKNIYIVSFSPNSGKTAFALGLALCLKENGINVGYFKPIGVGEEVRPGRFIDRDVALIRSVLGLKESIDELSPPIETRIGTYTFGKKVLEDVDFYRNRIMEAYNKIKDKYDFMIIEGRHRIQSLFTFKMDAVSLSKVLDSKILLVSVGIIDDVILQKSLIEGMNAKLLGAAFNNIGKQMVSKLEGELRPLLNRNKIKFYGYVPEKIELNSPTVEEYQRALGGQLLVGEQYLDNLIESVHIGAMRTESALKVLKRYTNYALVTGGDQSDLIYHALETDIGLLILTGNLYPDVKILVRAEEKKVPVLLVTHETATAYNISWTVSAGISPNQTDKIKLIKELVHDNINWKQIYEDA
jgi:BioD-like phosphotransacetylase family protein